MYPSDLTRIRWCRPPCWQARARSVRPKPRSAGGATGTSRGIRSRGINGLPSPKVFGLLPIRHSGWLSHSKGRDRPFVTAPATSVWKERTSVQPSAACGASSGGGAAAGPGRA